VVFLFGSRAIAPLPGSFWIAQSTHRQVLYRCPSCATQVWGKPGLLVLCGGEGCEAAAFEMVG
jgi:hypothetical protein